MIVNKKIQCLTTNSFVEHLNLFQLIVNNILQSGPVSQISAVNLISAHSLVSH